VSRSGAAAATPSPTPDHPWRTPQGAMGTASPERPAPIQLFSSRARSALGALRGVSRKWKKFHSENASFIGKI
jgi:hypothetical protein